MKKLNLKDRLILTVAKGAARLYVLSTLFGKQTYAKRAVRNVYKAARKK